jgi:hypothetical protein
VIAEPEERLSVRNQIALLDEAAIALKDDCIGFTLDRDFDLREIGLLYYVMASLHTLGEGLKRLARYSKITNEALVFGYREGNRLFINLSYSGVPGTHTDTSAVAKSCHSSEPQIVARELIDRGATHQLHVALYFSLHQTERPLDASLACRSQRIEIIAADADRLSADREGLQDMGPPLNPAIHEHFDPIAHGIDDFDELVE